MADNVSITQGSGTVIAADEVTRNAISEKQQVVKISLGAEGAFDNLVDSGEQLAAASVPVVTSVDEAVYLFATKTGASLTTSYAAFTSPGGAVKGLEIDNRTDKTLAISLDGGTNTHKKIDPYTTWGVNFKAMGKKESDAPQVKLDVSGTATGEVNCLYVRD